MKTVNAQERSDAAVRFMGAGEERWLRFKNAARQARMIWSGACNPLGISKTLADVCEACREVSEPGSEYRDQLAWAPARLIMAQLGFIIGVNGCGGYAGSANFDVFEDSQFANSSSHSTPHVHDVTQDSYVALGHGLKLLSMCKLYVPRKGGREKE